MQHRRRISPELRAKRKRVAYRVVGAAVAATLLPLIGLSAASQAAVAPHGARTVHSANGAASHAPAKTPYPVGVFNVSEPSHIAPPPANAMKGYNRIYVNDFHTWLPPTMWFLFQGVPKGDPSGLFEPSHVQVKGGMLEISTYKDPAYGDTWVSGGAGLYGIHPTYGAFFVRSRQTGMGPDNVDLLWPSNNQWPPEIDFNETGPNPYRSTWTDHFDTPTDQSFHTDWKVNITHWHTWGVVWTPKSVIFTLDGRQWGPTITQASQIPTIPMALDMQQQSWCGISPDCPTKSTSMLVDWVAVYTPKG
jgi:hypothetical protein